jgi:hypothetical protein
VGRAVSVGQAQVPEGGIVRYEWFRGGKLIHEATNATYTPTAADAGRRLTVRAVRVLPDGSRVTAYSVAVNVAKLKATIRLTERKLTKNGTATVRVSAPGIARATGKITVTWTKGAKTVTLTKSLKSGAAKIKVPAKVKDGTWRMKVTYKGGTAIAQKTRHLREVHQFPAHNTTLI